MKFCAYYVHIISYYIILLDLITYYYIILRLPALSFQPGRHTAPITECCFLHLAQANWSCLRLKLQSALQALHVIVPRWQVKAMDHAAFLHHSLWKDHFAPDRRRQMAERPKTSWEYYIYRNHRNLGSNM